MIRNTDRYYRESSFPLATFIFAKGHLVAGINSTDDPKKKSFAFVKTPDLEELVWLYKFGDRNDSRLLIEVHKYEQARRELLDRLND